MEQKLAELKGRLREIADIQSSAAVLAWDQNTYMPRQGGGARGRQLATLGRIAQEKFIDPAVGKLLDELVSLTADLPYDDDTASLVRVTRRQYERSIKVSPDFVAEMYDHTAQIYDVWKEARPKADFGMVAPYLEKSVALSRRYANFFPDHEHIADPLIDSSDYGMSVSTVRPLFAQLREALVPLVREISDRPEIDDSCLKQHYPENKQREFGLKVLQAYGFDFERGRQDKTAHPFMIRFNTGDIRITTRYKDNDLSEGLFSTLHECGHALYEMGVNPDFDGTALGRGASSGVHESQSRLWENLVGRSRLFWEYYYPQLQEVFPEQLNDVSLDTFYAAINKVAPSLIRTDADEVTYNLHVMIRFDLALNLLEGTLAVADLAEAWHARYEADLGVRAPNDTNGVLQDVHWYSGLIGGSFQGYTLGNVMSATFFEAALKAEPRVLAQIKQGEFATLHRWLRTNVYHHGRKFTAAELVERVSGEPLSIDPYIAYLHKKYGELYDLG